MSWIFWTVLWPMTLGIPGGYVIALLSRRKWARMGFRKGFEQGARAAAAHMFPLLIAKGVTPTEFGIALEGCGRPDCKACASRAQHKRTN